jgi:dipeptidyl aminopeptidase/acylaminoacyl peptidase
MRLLVLATLFLASVAHGDEVWVRLAAPRTIARGGHLAPRFSPDGRDLLVSGERFAGLSLLGLDGRARRLVDDAGAGVDARFLADGRVAFSARRAGERRTFLVGEQTAARLAAAGELPEPIAFTRDDVLYLRRGGGLVTVGAGDKFFGARPSPDGRRVAFLGLTTGVHVVDLATLRVTHLGSGTAPAWSPDGRFLVFERTEDDGHDVVASDLWLYEPGRRGLARLTATDALLERRPAFSPDGRSLAFDDDRGMILVADLEVTP